MSCRLRRAYLPPMWWGSGGNQVPLHTYKAEAGYWREGRQWTYSSTKIGGHQFDHLRLAGKEYAGRDVDLWESHPRRRFGGLPASFWAGLEEAQVSGMTHWLRRLFSIEECWSHYGSSKVVCVLCVSHQSTTVCHLTRLTCRRSLLTQSITACLRPGTCRRRCSCQRWSSAAPPLSRVLGSGTGGGPRRVCYVPPLHQ